MSKRLLKYYYMVIQNFLKELTIKEASSICIHVFNCTCPQLMKLDYLKTPVLYWGQKKRLYFNMSSFNSYKLTINRH